MVDGIANGGLCSVWFELLVRDGKMHYRVSCSQLWQASLGSSRIRPSSISKMRSAACASRSRLAAISSIMLLYGIYHCSAYSVPRTKGRLQQSANWPHCLFTGYYLSQHARCQPAPFRKCYLDQTPCATWATRRNLASCSAAVNGLPASPEAKPHCGLTANRSNGMYWVAS